MRLTDRTRRLRCRRYREFSSSVMAVTPTVGANNSDAAPRWKRSSGNTQGGRSGLSQNRTGVEAQCKQPSAGTSPQGRNAKSLPRGGPCGVN